MSSENFCYWLQGYYEISRGSKPTEEQWAIIMEHLKIVDKLESIKSPNIPNSLYYKASYC
jgi:hypothetical protein